MSPTFYLSSQLGKQITDALLSDAVGVYIAYFFVAYCYFGVT